MQMAVSQTEVTDGDVTAAWELIQRTHRRQD